MKKTLTFLVLIVMAHLGNGQSYLTHGEGYKAKDILSSHTTFSSFDVKGNYIYANDGDTIRLYNRETEEETAKFGKPESYPSYPSFVNVSPDGDHIWAGFTVSGNTDDRIYRINVTNGTWNLIGTLPGNFDMEFYNDSILVSALDESDSQRPVSIYSLDTTGNNNHREIIELKGNLAGLAVDNEGNVFYGSTDSTAIFQWDSTSVADVLDNSTANPLTIAEATKLTDLPADPYDCEVDTEGHLLFNFNSYSSDKVMGLWDGNSGDGHNFDTLATTDGDYDWFTMVKSIGNIKNHKTGNGAFILCWGRPIAKVTRSHPPVVSKAIENIQGYINDDDVSVDMTENFNDPDDENDFTYEIVLNSDSSVAIASISNQQLNINFVDAGQSNVIVQATNAGRSVQDTLVVGVYPKIEGNYHTANFEDNQLEPDSYWYGSDGSGGFNSSHAYFPNNYNADYDSFTGWAYSNMANDTTSGFSNQYSAITAAGFDTLSSGGSNYGLSYVSGASKVMFTDSSAHKVKGLYVTNSTYAALSMKYGDDYAKKFGGPDGTDPDWFKLSIWGYQDGAKTDTVEFYLADYRFEDNSKDYIVETWQWVDLSSLGEIDSLGFGLSSSDVGDYGMNTPAYFCIDNLNIENKAPYVANPLSDITIQEDATEKVVNISEVFTDPDNQDSKIQKTVKSNSNASIIEASISQDDMTLSPTGNSTGNAELIIQGESSGMTVTDTMTVTVTASTGITKINNFSVKVYPNPTKGQISIQTDAKEKLQVVVYNVSGKVVHQQNNYTPEESIDISNYTDGIYIIKVQSGKEIVTQKILKQ